ncbi:hypothetical protein ACWD4B_23095 [Streptomyces sp. NPDC002536]
MWLRSFAAALPSVRCAHDEAEVRAWFLRVPVPQYETCSRPSTEQDQRWMLATLLCEAVQTLETDTYDDYGTIPRPLPELVAQLEDCMSATG